MPFDSRPGIEETTLPAAVMAIDRMIEFFGPRGERWCKWAMEDNKKRRCLLGAIYIGADEQNLIAARHAVQRAVGMRRSIAGFNNHAESYEVIRAMLLRAREIAMEESNAV